MSVILMECTYEFAEGGILCSANCFDFVPAFCYLIGVLSGWTSGELSCSGCGGNLLVCLPIDLYL
jgi:hypothetical protein